MPTYYVELIQTDPEDSPTPGLSHYAGEVSGFATPEEALVEGERWIGHTSADSGHFYPCCPWQSADTLITHIVVYREEDDGERFEDQAWHSANAR